MVLGQILFSVLVGRSWARKMDYDTTVSLISRIKASLIARSSLSSLQTASISRVCNKGIHDRCVEGKVFTIIHPKRNCRHRSRPARSRFFLCARASKTSPACHKRFITNTKDQTRRPKNHAKLLSLFIPARELVGPSIRQPFRPCPPTSSPKRQAQKRLSVFSFSCFQSPRIDSSSAP